MSVITVHGHRRQFPTRVLVGLLRVYQRVVSPLYPPSCKYYPSCSQYAVDAVTAHGVMKGSRLALWRLLRCNPWSHGGVDEVKPKQGATPHQPQHIDSAEHHFVQPDNSELNGE